MGEHENTNSIRPIRFQALSEGGFDADITDKPSVINENNVNEDDIIKRPHKLNPNFTFEYSYPAVIFEKVCFSVDKSQQQGNLFAQYMYKLKSCVKRVSKADSNPQQVEILKSINLNVPYGSIFGLLGPSSCGKTTLLRCLVGLLRPTGGHIRLFCQGQGKANDDFSGKSQSRVKRANECKVPGSNVGYMPQDLGLYEDFSIRQLLTMFGRYMKMGSKLIATRIDFMAQFLDLPDVDREICSLSGGQKRRVSFAIACIHMPPLIILDEPTVGVDPLLRQSIWKYLRRLADEENKTIIITTHYIEEAAQADQVALMRAGEILVQNAPAKIMESNGCKTLEEAFLRICSNVKKDGSDTQHERFKLYPQPRFNWHDKIKQEVDEDSVIENFASSTTLTYSKEDTTVQQLRMRAQEKLALFDALTARAMRQDNYDDFTSKKTSRNKLSIAPNIIETIPRQPKTMTYMDFLNAQLIERNSGSSKEKRSLRGSKFMINDSITNGYSGDKKSLTKDLLNKNISERLTKGLVLFWALLYKNYRRNMNSWPLLAFQFMLPIIQMISFSLCVGGRPTNIGLGLVNHDQLIQPTPSDLIGTDNVTFLTSISPSGLLEGDEDIGPLMGDELLSERYLSFLDHDMITVKPYSNLKDALDDVRKAKLWAAMEIGENFTFTILRRFDLENFYQLDLSTIQQSVIKLYPDRSNKVLDMICHRSLVNSYRQFLLDQFEHFKRLPIEIREPIFDIKPNLISNSIDGYTESIAAGLLASLTYIMAAGLTTFIMVVERSAGILERTYTCGINPVAYLLAHAAFRCLVMMVQIAMVMILTFYILQQPMVGSIWLAYLMLMTLNLTGISYGLLISSLVNDQNGAALTIVSSLVVKITMSGILWPFEAIPRWLRTICYVQPLTMPVQALKTITLKGRGLEDRTVGLGFLVAILWLVVFITIASKRFKFYQH